MRIVPAVDIRGGLCVNLVQGDYKQETVFSENPVEQACLWWSTFFFPGIILNCEIHCRITT